MSGERTQNAETSKKRPVTVTVRADLLDEAKILELNASQAAEAGIEAAVKSAKEQAWLEECKDAIQAYNERITLHGPLIKPIWLRD